MQMNLESTSLASRAVALPVPKSPRIAIFTRRPTAMVNPSGELQNAWRVAARLSFGERLAWLTVGLSAVGVLGVSLWL